MTLKAKQKGKRKKDRKRKIRKGKKSIDLVMFVLFAVSFHKSKDPFVDSNIKSEVLISP